MTEFLNELSENQINYLKQQKKHKYIVGISRILILFSFLFLWEFTANVGIIDSFIFSSPSKIALCFWGMVLDKSIFLHTNVTLYETILSFLLVTATSILVTILISSPSHFPCFRILSITFMNNLRHGNSKVTIIGIKFSYQRIFIGYFRVLSPTIDIVSLTILFSLNTNIKCLISIIIPPAITTFGRRKEE